MKEKQLEKATFAAGCFWCGEAVFQRIKGVEKVRSGFTGGEIKNPAYREVVMGHTNHAEAIELTFNPQEITFEELLYIFFGTHDPTTLNRQQNDVGTQYRSAVFYHSEAQKEIAQKVKNILDVEEIFKNPIVTEITAASEFYEASVEHQDFYNQHRNQPYCRVIIDPKIEKLKSHFADKMVASGF